MRLTPTRARLLTLAVFGLVLVVATGCGPSYRGLTGKVTYMSFPVKGGTVTLVPEGGGESFSTQIQEDGTYTFERVATGKYKVCVDTRNLKPPHDTVAPFAKGKVIKNAPPEGAALPEGYKMSNPMITNQAENARRYVPIPVTFSEVGATPLKIEVESGSGMQSHNIIMS